MTAQVTALAESKTDKSKQVIALYNKDDRLVGIVNGWRVADGVMELDGSIKRAVLTAELSPMELYEIDDQISRLRDLRGTL